MQLVPEKCHKLSVLFLSSTLTRISGSPLQTLYYLVVAIPGCGGIQSMRSGGMKGPPEIKMYGFPFTRVKNEYEQDHHMWRTLTEGP